MSSGSGLSKSAGTSKSPFAVPNFRWMGPCFNRSQAREVPSGAHNDHLFARQRLLKKPRQVSFRLMHIHFDDHD